MVMTMPSTDQETYRNSDAEAVLVIKEDGHQIFFWLSIIGRQIFQGCRHVGGLSFETKLGDLGS